MERQFDMVIIGAGPAGLTASLYASRAGLSVAMVEAGAPGGKLMKTYLVDNYPGMPDIPGPDLGMQMYEQAVKFGTEIVTGEVEKITEDKKVILKDGTELQGKAVIIATGTVERTLNIPGEAEAIGHGESFCAVCDGAFFRNKDVVVIGGGNAALEESEFLTQFVNKVTIVMRRPVYRADQKLQNQAHNNPKISFMQGYTPEKILLDDYGSVKGIEIENVETKERQVLDCAGIFPYIGQDPATQFVKDLGITDERGYLVVDEKMETKIPGIYGAGDCNHKDLRQIVTATGDGATAALAAFHEIKGY